MWTEDDVRYMREAHELAKSAEGRTTPDPMVGAVLVKDGRIISIGYHGEVATPHAEAWAIQKAGKDAKGATLYVNLEPCAHHGNNPPCAELIVNSDLKEVVVSMKDPNPLVNGKGIRILKKHGIKVRFGLLETEAKRLNEVFIKYITTRKPFVVLKSALTIDGKIATRTGASRWVAGPTSLHFAHRLRNYYDAILVGVNTILVDNPKLTTRLVEKIKNPIRIVLDSTARTPLNANVMNTKEARTIIVVSPAAPKKRVEALRSKGAEILTIDCCKLSAVSHRKKLDSRQSKIDIRKLMQTLGKMKITSILLEGGGEANASFIEAGEVDKAHFIIVPKIFGGRDAKTSVEGLGVKLPSQAKWLKQVHVDRLDGDILVTGYLR